MTLGFNYGQRQVTYEQAERETNGMTPHKKGEFRKSYWAGRCSARFEDLGRCVRYATLDQRKRISDRLDAAFHEILIEMYGVDGAQEFLDHTKDVVYGRT